VKEAHFAWTNHLQLSSEYPTRSYLIDIKGQNMHCGLLKSLSTTLNIVPSAVINLGHGRVVWSAAVYSPYGSLPFVWSRSCDLGNCDIYLLCMVYSPASHSSFGHGHGLTAVYTSCAWCIRHMEASRSLVCISRMVYSPYGSFPFVFSLWSDSGRIRLQGYIALTHAFPSKITPCALVLYAA